MLSTSSRREKRGGSVVGTASGEALSPARLLEHVTRGRLSVGGWALTLLAWQQIPCSAPEFRTCCWVWGPLHALSLGAALPASEGPEWTLESAPVVRMRSWRALHEHVC